MEQNVFEFGSVGTTKIAGFDKHDQRGTFPDRSPAGSERDLMTTTRATTLVIVSMTPQPVHPLCPCMYQKNPMAGERYWHTARQTRG